MGRGEGTTLGPCERKPIRMCVKPGESEPCCRTLSARPRTPVGPESRPRSAVSWAKPSGQSHQGKAPTEQALGSSGLMGARGAMPLGPECRRASLGPRLGLL